MSQIFIDVSRARLPMAYKATHVYTLISLIGFIMAMLLAGCAGPGETPVELSGHILIAGSTALMPLAQAAAASFEKLHPNVKVDVNGGGSVLGLESVTGLKSPQANIGDSDLYADPALYPDPN